MTRKGKSKRKRESDTIALTEERPSQRQRIRNVQEYIDANLTEAEKAALINGILIRENATNGTKPHLMALPKELRLKIFEYTVIEAIPIIVTATGPPQPALLQVCQQIREESLAMYYTCNGFVYDLMDYNMAQLVPALNIHTTYFRPPGPFEGWATEYRFQGRQVGFVGFEFSGVPNWQNLVEWMRISYDHKHIPWFADRDDLEPEYMVLTALSEAMMNLGKQGVSWVAASSTLDSWHQMLIMSNPAWAT
ncbi:hypothetical protein LTR56_010030 [Elasticomyces elasticus]|nr:hypothetical protein LTR56_010030 [Elasticomyces elasticus]KAK4931592.1 hypothetical protein LTR49_001982 [Elasticomyces elasticus]KAK5766751.1 hypothetical protein LTS12_003102 [Elasticomyces elasticus]